MYGFCITAFVFVSLNKRSKLNTNAIFCERLFALASQQAFLRGPYYLPNIVVFHLATRKAIKFKKMEVKLKQLASAPQY
jgi:hypothetical protein